MRELNELIHLLKSDATALADKEGNTPIITLAKKIRREADIKPLYTSKVLDLFNNQIEDLTIEEFTLLLSFIKNAEINFEALKKGFIHSLTKLSGGPNAIKRGLLYRFLVENDVQGVFNTSQIESDEELEKSDKWLYIDCIFTFNWQLAEQKINELLDDNDQIKFLVLRIPYFKKRIGSPRLGFAYIKWSNKLKDESKIKLREWFTFYKIDVKEKKSFLNIKLYQNKIITEAA